MSEKAPRRVLGIFLVVLATAFWSTSGIFISIVMGGSNLSPIGLAFWRDLSTFLVLLIPISLLRRDLLRVKRRDLPWLLLMGALSIGLFHVLWNAAIVQNGASISTVMQANAPIFVTVAAWLIWKESLSGRKLIAIALAVSGTVMLSGLESASGVQLTPGGLLTALAAAGAYSSLTLLGKKLSGDYKAWTILVYVFGFATLVLSPFQIGRPLPELLDGGVSLSFIGLVLVTTISGFASYTFALRHLPASVAAITSNTEVPFAAILAYFLLGERLDVPQIIGATMIVAAVVLISLPTRPRRRRKLPAVGEQIR